MPDGKSYHPIPVSYYLRALEAELARLVASGDLTAEQANTWAVSVLKALGYTSQEDYATRIATDDRMLNPSAEEDVARMPPGFNPEQLPFYEAIRAEAEYIPRMAEFQQTQAQEQFAREQTTLEAEQRKESWAREAALRERPGEYEPRIPTGEKAVREFLEEERPGGIQGFIESKLPSVLEQFQREQGGARRAWWSTLQRPEREERAAAAQAEAQRQLEIRKEGRAGGLRETIAAKEFEKGAPLAQQDLTPEEYYYTVAPERYTAAQQEYLRLQEPTERRAAVSREDPLAAYLAAYPWTAEFMKLSPAQRGFRPSMYAPSARWFT